MEPFLLIISQIFASSLSLLYVVRQVYQIYFLFILDYFLFSMNIHLII